MDAGSSEPRAESSMMRVSVTSFKGTRKWVAITWDGGEARKDTA